jgi:hypothetical protein
VSALAQQQQALLQALWASRPDAALAAAQSHLLAGPLHERGLRAYRSNGRLLAERALAGAYPVVAQMLGEENFGPLAQQLWLRHPPMRGDLAQWGGALAALIETLPDLAEQEPYLADVARLEWALHQAATARDSVLDIESFALLQTHEASQLTLCLVPGSCCIASAWPIASIVLAHREDSPSLDEASARLRDRIAETALVWRHGLKPRMRQIVPEEVPFVLALQEGRALSDALERAPALAFDQWLAPAVQCGLVTGAALL